MPRPNVGLRPGQIAFWTLDRRTLWSMDGRRWVELDRFGAQLDSEYSPRGPMHRMRWAAEDLQFETELATADRTIHQLADSDWGFVHLVQPTVIAVSGHHNQVGDFLQRARGAGLAFRPGQIHGGYGAFDVELPRRRAGARLTAEVVDEPYFFVRVGVDTSVLEAQLADAAELWDGGGQYARIRSRAEDRITTDRAKAYERARELLREQLTAEQWETYTDRGYFDVVVPSGRTYRIREGITGNVSLLDANGLGVVHYCAHARGAGTVLPEPDVHLGQMLMLLADEDEFIARANASIYSPTHGFMEWAPPDIAQQRIAEVDRQLAAARS